MDSQPSKDLLERAEHALSICSDFCEDVQEPAGKSLCSSLTKPANPSLKKRSLTSLTANFDKRTLVMQNYMDDNIQTKIETDLNCTSFAETSEITKFKNVAKSRKACVPKHNSFQVSPTESGHEFVPMKVQLNETARLSVSFNEKKAKKAIYLKDSTVTDQSQYVDNESVSSLQLEEQKDASLFETNSKIPPRVTLSIQTVNSDQSQASPSSVSPNRSTTWSFPMSPMSPMRSPKTIDPLKILRRIRKKQHRTSYAHVDSHQHILHTMQRLQVTEEEESIFWAKTQRFLKQLTEEAKAVAASGSLETHIYPNGMIQLSPGHQGSAVIVTQTSDFQTDHKNDTDPTEDEQQSKMGVYSAVSLKMKAARARRNLRKARQGIIMPNSRWKVYFDIFVGFLIIYSVITIPIGLSFGGMDGNAARKLELAIDAVFLFDMVLTFFTALPEGKRFNYNRRAIVLKYLRGMFLPDLLSSFPFDEVVRAAMGDGHSLSALRMFRIIRIIRLLRLIKLGRLFRLSSKLQTLDLASTFQVDPAIISLISRMSKILYVAHAACCIWYVINGCDKEVDDWSRCGSDTLLSSRYLASLYFTLQTMMTIGYGDVKITTSGQRAFAMLLEISGPMTFGVIVSSISEVVDSLDSRSKSMAERLNAIKEYTSERNFPLALNRKINAHFVYFYNHTTVFREQAIVQNLPDAVYKQLLFEKHHKHIQHLQFFHHFQTNQCANFVSAALPLLKPFLLQAGESIVCQGDPAEEIYFVRKGQINGLKRIRVEILIAVYQQGSTLNLANVLCSHELHCTFRAACQSDMLWLDREDLEMLTDMFPEVGNSLKEMVRDEQDNLRRVMESPTVTREYHMSKELILYEPGEGRPDKVIACKLIEIEPIKGVYNGHQKRTIRTVRFRHFHLPKALQKHFSEHHKKIHRAHSKWDDGDVKVIEKEETPESLQRKMLIDPCSKFKLRWDLFIGIVTLYSGLVIPVRIGFAIEDAGFNIFDGVVDCCFLLDIIFTFRTIDEAAPGLYFADPWVIALRYFATWFIIDLVSAVPLDSLLFLTSQFTESLATKSLRLVRISRFFRFFKLMRLFKVAKRFKGWSSELSQYGYYLNQLVLLFVLLLYFGHLFGCLWGFIASEEGLAISWMSTTAGIKTGTNIFDQYMAAIYWAFTTVTTVGFGDIVPITDEERAYGVIVFVVGSTINAFIVSNVSNLAYQLSILKKVNKKNVAEINDYLMEQKLGFDISNTIRKHMAFAFACQRSETEAQILKRLPCMLRRKAAMNSFQEIIEAVPILHDFHDSSQAALTIITQRLVPEYSQAGKYIFSPIERSKGLYFVITGIVEEIKIQIYTQDDKDCEVLCIVERGGFFGYRGLLKLSAWNIGAKAFTDCQLYFLSTQDMTYLDEKFPSVARDLQLSIAKYVLEQKMRSFETKHNISAARIVNSGWNKLVYKPKKSQSK